jgi:NAD(P)-dependent dehydrogenase (short-subunit alcohol dehydrogenase family)
MADDTLAQAQAVEFAIKQFGRVDYLTNNAGPGYLEPLTKTIDELIHVLLGANMCSPVLPGRRCRS